MFLYRIIVYISILLFFLPITACANHAATVQFPEWLKQFKQEARTQGISEVTLDKAFSGITPNPRVIALDRKQPECTKKQYRQYVATVITPAKIKEARRLYRQHHKLLTEIGARYGVQPRFIVSLWGIETNFGTNTGNLNIIRSLATLAFDGRRSDFFRKELLQALMILDQHPLTNSALNGSWAGAMGQTQFMPSSYNKFAVDYNHDGFADIWNSHADIFASIANYLSRTGWDPAVSWGRKVQLPHNFDQKLVGIEQGKPLQEWGHMGVKAVNGASLPIKPFASSVIILDDTGSESYIVYSNYHTLLDWNKSKYFATTVGLLADRIE